MYYKLSRHDTYSVQSHGLYVLTSDGSADQRCVLLANYPCVLIGAATPFGSSHALLVLNGYRRGVYGPSTALVSGVKVHLATAISCEQLFGL